MILHHTHFSVMLQRRRDRSLALGMTDFGVWRVFNSALGSGTTIPYKSVGGV